MDSKVKGWDLDVNGFGASSGGLERKKAVGFGNREEQHRADLCAGEEGAEP